ncbi:MAG: DUF3800 domain-containing protein [Nitrospirota bacterium]
MRLFFLDESGEAFGTTPIMVVGGLIVNAADWPVLRDGLAAVKTSCNIGADVEVKWRHTRHQGGHTNPLRSLTAQERGAFARQVLGLIRKCEKARVIGSVIDVQKARSLGKDSSQFYDFAVTFCIERYQYYLRAARDQGIVVQDRRHERQDMRLRAFYDRLMSRGSYWTTFTNIIEGVFLTPSEYSVGIQLADFVVGALYVAHRNPTPEEAFYNIIRGKITGDPRTGKRHGLKFWP